MSSEPTDRNRNRNRWLLITIFAMFFGSMLVAGLLRFSGWRPPGSKNFGEMLDPPGDLRSVVARRLDGRTYAWNPVARRWRIALAPPAPCDVACVKLLRDIDTVWRLTGRQADRVDVLWLCAAPACTPSATAPSANAPRPGTLQLLQADARLRGGFPRLDDPRGAPVYVVDPNGFVILRYAPGFDPAGLRADLAKLLKLQ